MRLSVSDILKITQGKLRNGNLEDSVDHIFYNVIREEQEPQGEFLYIPYISVYRRIDTSNKVSSMLTRGGKGVIVDRKLHKDTDTGHYDFSVEVEDLEEAVINLARYIRKEKKLQVIAVTGSSGKTTSKELIANILSASGTEHNKTLRNINGYGGASHTIFACKEEGLAVLEVGVNGLKRLPSLAKAIAANYLLVTNINHTHFDKFPDLREVAKHKLSLGNSMTKPCKKVMYGQCQYLRPYIDSDTTTFGWDKQNNYYIENIVNLGTNGSTFVVNDHNETYTVSTPLIGKHNIMNCLGVFALCSQYGINKEYILQGIKNFKGIKDDFYSTITLENVEGWNFLDDSQHFNLPALAVGLEAFSNITEKQRGVVILSYDYKFESDNFNFTELLKIIKDNDQQIKKMILIHNGWNKWKQLISQLGIETEYVQSKEECAELIKNKIPKGDYIYIKGDFNHHLRGILSILKGETYEF